MGHNMAITPYNEVVKNGGNMSGEGLSIGRRAAKGVQGASQLIGIGLGGAAGLNHNKQSDRCTG